MAFDWEARPPSADNLEGLAQSKALSFWQRLGELLPDVLASRAIDLADPQIVNLTNRLTNYHNAGDILAWRSAYRGLKVGVMVVHGLVPETKSTGVLLDDPETTDPTGQWLMYRTERYLDQRESLIRGISKIIDVPRVAVQPRYLWLATRAAGAACLQGEQVLFDRIISTETSDPQAVRLFNA